MFKKKGIFLIYVLVTAVLISIFLIGAVENMHNSFFLTNKFTGENKAYWAAESGLQYCEYKLKSNLSWPFDIKDAKTEEAFGKFKVISTIENNGNGYCIHGESEDDEEEFCIYFSKNPSKNTNDLTADLVPVAFPSEPKNLAYCSYNSIDEDNLKSIYQKRSKIEYSQVSFKVSKAPDYTAIITTPGVYVISDGRSRGYRTVLEKMLVPDNSNTIGGGIYCGGNILIGKNDGLKNIQGITARNYRFKVSQTSNSRANIYCKKNVIINREQYINHMGPTPKLGSYIFPFFIGDGTLYLKNSPSLFQIIDKTGNQYGASSKIISNNGNQNNGNEQIKKEHGLNIEEYKQEFDKEFPKITWNDINQMKNHDSPTEVSGGTYCAIKSDDDNNTYILCYLPTNFLDENYNLNEDALNLAMQNGSDVPTNTTRALNTCADNIERLFRNKSKYKKQTFIRDLNEEKEEAKQALQEYQDRYATSGSRIKEFVESLGGQVLCGDYKIQEKGKESRTNKSDSNFSIKTVNINTIRSISEKESTEGINQNNRPPNQEKETEIDKITYNTVKTPIITINKSITVNDSNKGFTLLTLNLQSSPLNMNIEAIIDAMVEGENYESMIPKPEFTYSIANDISTDVIFGQKNTGLNEAYILKKINSNINIGGVGVASNFLYSPKEDKNAVQTNSLIACQSVNLYSNGPVILYGKLSGTGQILSNKSVYFRSGTQLNTGNYMKITKENTYVENSNVGETSKIGVYSGKCIKMGAPEGDSEENTLELHNKIKYLLENESDKSITEMANKILYLKNEDKPIKVTANDLGRFATDSSYDPNDDKIKLDELTASIAADWKDPITLSKLMRKYYGFEDREAEDYIKEVIKRNCIYDENKKIYKMPENKDKIEIMTRSSSSFSGVLYACGGFKCDAEGTNIVINGAIVTYGADPAGYQPGSGGGLGNISHPDMLNIDDFGNIEIYNCKDFSIVYDSSDLAAFVNTISDKPTNLSGIYSNKL